MRMTGKISLIVLSFVIWLMTGPLNANDFTMKPYWHYFSTDEPGSGFVILESEKVIVDSGVSGSIYICPEESSYVCFFNSNVGFSFPKNLESEKWKLRGHSFNIDGKRESCYEGGRKCETLYFVSGLINGSKYKYIYSRKFGLIYISRKLAGEAREHAYMTLNFGFGRTN